MVSIGEVDDLTKMYADIGRPSGKYIKVVNVSPYQTIGPFAGLPAKFVYFMEENLYQLENELIQVCPEFRTKIVNDSKLQFSSAVKHPFK